MVFDALIPDGPLHPVDAAWGVGTGLLITILAGRLNRRWVGFVLVGIVGVVGYRQGNELVDGYVDRPDSVFAIGVTVAAVALTCVRPVRVSTMLPASIAACIGIWAVVPDTEVPLIAGAVLVGAAARVPLGPASRFSGVLVLVPVAAAVAGSVGRPGRLGPALLLGGISACLAILVLVGGRSMLGRRQRAGMPTTVAPGATSSVTTAPAPTTAF